MSAATITVEEQVNKFSEYPEAMDSYFQTKTIIIEILPKDLDPELEKKFVKFQVTSAKQFCDYLDAEISFWEEKDPDEKLKEFSYIDKLRSAKRSFLSAERYFKNNNPGYAKTELDSSVGFLSQGTVYSKTSIVKFLLSHKENAGGFLRGIRLGFLKEKTQSLNSASIATFEGLHTALVYRKYIKELGKASKDDIASFSESIATAYEMHSKLNEAYNKAFFEQEKRLLSIVDQSNTHFENLNNNSDAYFAQAQKQLDDIEFKYTEKLRLQEPANYWKKQEVDYRKKGGFWLVMSLLVAGIIMGILITILACLPDLFSRDSHWFDVFKNSAIITVLASVAIYILRIFVKMTMSSLHLARDAKERNNLTYFYLSLIEDGSVTDKERAIILNSLFSRTDTGLLKGDSSPTMSGNITELVESLAKNKP